MDELEPWPEDDTDEAYRDRPTAPRTKKLAAPTPSLPRSTPSPSSDAWQNKADSNFGSPPRNRARPLFAGPPPPIASSIMVKKGPSSDSSSASGRRTQSHARASQTGLGSLLFDYKHDKQPGYQPDSVWRGLRRREKALEGELQQLLDLQASGLVAGRDGGMLPSSSEQDEYSDTGSSTPTGTFYSTATSKSRMMNSLYVPTRSTPEGNVIPVRQPKSSRPRGLRSTRTGLRRSISALAQLKAEEDSLVDDALTERKKALGQLSKLHMRRESVTAELRSLEEDEEEPLGQELRKLGTKYDTMTQEIRELDEKLVGMRNQRRRLRAKMEDVKSRRDAGLSGYRGALKDVDSEVTTLMHRPPIQPLDLEALNQVWSGKSSSAGGMEFLRMIPERRTLEMAKSWWESEVTILEQRKAQVEDDRLALEEGGALWSEVMQLVSDYEARLRGLMKGEPSGSSVKGKEKVPTQEDMIRDQLPEMEKVMNELEKHQHFAEDKGWNLLICAIGAELEAFGEAQEMLQGILDGEGDEESSQPPTAQSTNADEHNHQDQHDESSDNEVPPDLLVSHSEDRASNPPSQASPQVGPELKRMESGSENDVPPEFLAEHKEAEHRDKID